MKKSKVIKAWAIFQDNKIYDVYFTKKMAEEFMDSDPMVYERQSVVRVEIRILK